MHFMIGHIYTRIVIVLCLHRHVPQNVDSLYVCEFQSASPARGFSEVARINYRILVYAAAVCTPTAYVNRKHLKCCI